MKKRVVLESVGAAVLTAIICIIALIVNGMRTTKMYVPDIINSYESVDMLQHEVTISAARSYEEFYIAAAGILAGMIYYSGRSLWIAKRER